MVWEKGLHRETVYTSGRKLERNGVTYLDREELLDLLSKAEWTHVEFKRAADKLPKDVWETVSAFSNTTGGTIIFGIEEKGGQTKVVGVNDPERLQSDFLTALRGNKFNVSLSARAERFEFDDKMVLTFYVPEMPRQAKPVYYDGSMKNAFLRQAGSDFRCTEEELKRLVREASEQSSDSMILEHYTMDDLDEGTIAKYRNFLSSHDPASPLLGLSQPDFLKRIGAYSRNRANAQEGITLAGLLLFGKSDAILERLQNYEIQYFYLNQTEWGADQRWDDRIVCQDNLIETFLQLFDRIKRHMDAPFYLKDSVQRTEQTPVMIAIREALVNLLIHQDYFERKIAQVRHLSNAIVFVNPGTAPMREEELLDGDLTSPRNPVIAKAFRLVGWAEVAGTGLLKIVKSWKAMNFELPAIENNREKYQFTITLSQQHLLAEEDKKWLARFTDLEDQEKLILAEAKKSGTVNNAGMRVSLGIADSLTVTQMLSHLCEKHYLNRIGTKGPSVRYELHPSVKALIELDNMDFGDRERAILEFCVFEPKSVKQILEQLGMKHRDTLREQYLRSLLLDEYLCMKYPENPAHRNQKYYTNVEILLDEGESGSKNT
jgi:ATP-dependent DNA helicase RecG